MNYYIVERTRRPDGAIQVTLAEPEYPEFTETEFGTLRIDLGSGRTLHIQEIPFPFGGGYKCMHFRACVEDQEKGWGKEFEGQGDRKAAWRRYLRQTYQEAC